ncbi:MAG: 50S ribosomal protein L11 [Candidatus Aenigmarchaeota archaeon]|nr:50S ribosomal protein L11 [Candidatus Aenigmarchaeota archaeon]
MPKQTVDAMVEGGKASAGPPLGPALGPLGVNIGKVIAEINSKTKDLAGIKVPVKVTVDTGTKEFSISVGTPPVSALIKKEIGLQKGSGFAGNARAGDVSTEQVKKVARLKFGSDAPGFVSQVMGTCRSMGITVDKGQLDEGEKKLLRQKVEEAKAAKAAGAAKATAPAPPPAAK